VVVQSRAGSKRYHVEFMDGYKEPIMENLIDLAKEPFAGKSEYLDRLVEKGVVYSFLCEIDKARKKGAFPL